MAAKRGPSRLRRMLGAILIAIILLIIAGLLIVDYSAAAAVVIGITLALVLAALVRALFQRRRAGQPIWHMVAVLLIILAVPVLWLISPQIGAVIDGDDSGEPLDSGEDERPVMAMSIEGYQVQVTPGERLGQDARVTEVVVYDVLADGEVVADDQRVAYPERRVLAAPHGFLLREVIVVPLNEGVNTPVTVSYDGVPLEARLCGSLTCETAMVRVTGYPVNTFYAARDASPPEHAPYGTNETVTWTTRELRDGIEFSYIPPPFHHLRGVLTPLIGATSADEWIVGLVSMISSLAAMPIIGPVIQNVLEDELADWLRSKLRGKKRKSSSGKQGRS